MEKTTAQTNQKAKTLLCDLPNTLFDARHRTIPELNTTFISDIKNDELNYTVYTLIKEFHKLGYNIIFTHYCLDRVKHNVVELMEQHKLPTHNLYTNFTTQKVYDNASLKRHLAEEHFDFDLVIDNDPTMRAFWNLQGIALINVPLTVEYSD